MIDEPLALLAEAFGQEPELVILPVVEGEVTEDRGGLPVVAGPDQIAPVAVAIH